MKEVWYYVQERRADEWHNFGGRYRLMSQSIAAMSHYARDYPHKKFRVVKIATVVTPVRDPALSGSLDTRRFTIGGSDCGAAALWIALRATVPTTTASMSPCHEWHTAPADGYPRMRAGGRKVRVHRYFYESRYGPLPDGYVVHHVCENKRCVNTDHLRGVTKATHLAMHDTTQRGLAVAHANKRARTHCNHGHPFTPENTYYNAGAGTRFCRECHLSRKRAAYSRRKGEGS